MNDKQKTTTIDRKLDRMIVESKDKIRQTVSYSTYETAERILKKNESRFSKFFKELS